MDLLNNLTVKMLPVVPKPIVGKVASRYIAGPNLSDAVRVTRELNNQGVMATIDLLGEDTKTADDAKAGAATYYEILKAISDNKLDANVSLKPTHMGLDVGYDLCRDLITGIVKAARDYNNFVRIDMENVSTTDKTFELYHGIHNQMPNVGVVIQARLRRTLKDVAHLTAAKANLRLCKGIYNEPRPHAYRNRAIIINNFGLILKELLQGGCYVGIATHCEETIWQATKVIHKLKLNRDQYEFQMLLGVEDDLRKILVDQGHRMRVYVPFGTEWYAYSTRRLIENPQMAGHVMRAFVGLETQ